MRTTIGLLAAAFAAWWAVKEPVTAAAALRHAGTAASHAANHAAASFTTLVNHLQKGATP